MRMGGRILILFLVQLLSHKVSSQSAIITVNGLAVSSGSSTQVCLSKTITFDVSYTGLGSNPSFNWSFQNGSPDSSSLKTVSVTFDSVGSQTVQLSVYGIDTISSSITAVVLDTLTDATISINGPTSICYNSTPGQLTCAITGGIAPYTYQWERKIGNGSWTSVGSNSSLYNETTNLISSTQYRVTASSSNCGSALSNVITVAVFAQITAPSITSSQTICNGTAPNNLSRTSASGGDGSFTYEWQYSTNGTSNWQAAGQSGVTYSPGILTADRWFRVKALNACGNFYSNTIKVTVRAALTAGTISPSNPLLCHNGSQLLTLGGTSGADGVYSYIWERRLVGNVTWLSAPGSTNSSTYNTGALTASYEFRVRVNSGCNVESISGTRTVNVAPQFVVGTINLTGPSTICYSTLPGLLSASGFTGGRTPYTYQWERKIGAGSWQNVGSNSSTYSETTNLTLTTEYRVTVTSAGGCGSLTSSAIVINVQPDITASSISSAQTICHNTLPALLSRTNATGADGNFVYEWQYSTNGTSNWQNTGQSGISYSPGVLTADRWFRVRIVNTCATTYSNIIKVTVRAPLAAGTLSPSAPQICYNAFQVLTVTGTSGGDAVYGYIWERKPVGTGSWTTAPGSTNSNTYNTSNLTQSYEYRVRVNSGCGVEDITNVVTVNVAGQLGISAISINGPNIICHSSLPGQLSITVTGGRTPYSYQWERKIGAGSWINVGSSSNLYTETTPLTATTDYRVTATSSSGCGSITSSIFTVTVRPAITNAVVSGAQTICNNTVPALLTRTNASGSDGSFTYDWEYSQTGMSPWVSTGQSGMSYNPGVLSSSRWFRVKIINATCSGLVYSNTVKVNVRDPLNAGVLSTANTETCYNTSVNLSLSGTSGADTNYLRIWQRRIPGTGSWATAPASVNLPNYNTGNLLLSYEYRVIVNSSCNVTDTSNIILIDVAPEFVGGTIIIANQEDSVCYNQEPVPLSASGFAGGRQPYTYVWEKRTTTTSWVGVGQNQAIYQDQSPLKEDSYYRLTVISDTGCGIIQADSVRIRVNPLPSSDSSFIIGSYGVCSNAQGIMYKLYPGYGDSIYWHLDNGIVRVDSADRVIVDFNDVGIATTDTLYAFLKSSRTLCERVVKIPISITANRAPDKAEVTRKANSTILICSDSTPGMTYEWGFYERANGNEVIIPGANLRYCQYPGTIDTIANLYFVRTSLNGCSSTSYYELRSKAFGEEEFGLQDKFILFPNPSLGQVSLKGPLKKINTLFLVSITGVQIELEFDPDSGRIELPNVPQGIYVMLIKTENVYQSINLSIVKP